MLENQNFWLEIVKIIPSFLWVIGAFIALFLWYDLHSRQTLAGYYAQQVQDTASDLRYVERAFEDVLKVAHKNPHWHVEVADTDKTQMVQRLRRNRDVLRERRVLWLDDRPDTLANEIRLFQQLGVEVETVTAVGDALGHLRMGHFDLLISDIARPEGQSNGLATLQTLHDHHPTLPALFYVGNFNVQDGVPLGAFGITNRPDELLHLVLDIVERKPPRIEIL